MEPASHADLAGELMLGEPAYWLTVLLLAFLGLAMVAYAREDAQSKDAEDELLGWSPAAHIGSLDELFAEKAAGGDGAQEPAAAAAAATPAAQLWASVSKRDHALGEWVYLATRRSSTLKHVATAITLSGDEAIWFSMPVVLAVGHLLTGIGPPATFGFCVEVLNDVMMVCVIEMGMKFCVQRDRPGYAPQSTFYILAGEWWSFPSGHSQRAAYVAHRLFLNASLRAAIFGPLAAGSALLPCCLYLWAALVGWSRVAKGRHSPLDVTVGLVAGILLAELTIFIGLPMWTVGRFVAGSVECVLLGAMAARPELRLEGFYVHGGLQVLWFSVQPYCLWLAMSWSMVFALSSTLFCTSYALGALSRPFTPC